MSKFTKPKGADDFINKALEKESTKQYLQADDTGYNTSVNTNINISVDANHNIDTENELLVLSKHNPRSVKKKAFNLRLNDYYLEVIRYLSNPDEGISMQSIIQDIVIKELDKKVTQLKSISKNK